jgi:hypothetical protein
VFKVLKHKTVKGVFGKIDFKRQTVEVQNVPAIFYLNETIESLTRFINPRIPDPFESFELVTVTNLVYEENLD